MKFVTPLILAISFLVSAEAEEHIIASATLKTENESISTPKADLYFGVESIRRTVFKVNDRNHTFALKSSAFKKADTFHYAVSISLSDTKENEFVLSEKGETERLRPMEFSFEKDGVNYTATVNLVPK